MSNLTFKTTTTTAKGEGVCKTAFPTKYKGLNVETIRHSPFFCSFLLNTSYFWPFIFKLFIQKLIALLQQFITVSFGLNFSVFFLKIPIYSLEPIPLVKVWNLSRNRFKRKTMNCHYELYIAVFILLLFKKQNRNLVWKKSVVLRYVLCSLVFLK